MGAVGELALEMVEEEIQIGSWPPRDNERARPSGGRGGPPPLALESLRISINNKKKRTCFRRSLGGFGPPNGVKKTAPSNLFSNLLVPR